MTDDEMYEILNDFARQHALAVGLEVNVSPGGMSFKTVDFTVGGKYEYSSMLGDMISGAEQLLMWARREGKVRFVRLSQKDSSIRDKYYTQKGAKRPKIQLKRCKKGH